MKRRRIACVFAFLTPLILAGQAKHEKVTEEERDYAESIIERRNQENSA